MHACLVTQLCTTLCNPMDCSSQGSSVHEILQARILGCVVMPSSRGSSQPRDRTQVSRIAGRFFTIWATREAQYVISEDRYFRQSVLWLPSQETFLRNHFMAKMINNKLFASCSLWQLKTACVVSLNKNFI